MSRLVWQIKGLDFSWPDRGEVLKGVELEINSHDRILLRGINGSGKTTLMRLLTGELAPSAGSVLFEGKDAIRQTPETWKSVISCSQNPRENLFGLIPRHDLEIWSLAHPERFATQSDRTIDDPLQEKLDQPYAALSGGELRAASLLWLPRFMDLFWLLDEPTAGLDASRKDRFWGLLQEKKKLGTGMLMVSHDPEMPESLFDRVLTLMQGRLEETP